MTIASDDLERIVDAVETIEPGDKLRWAVDGEGELSVEVVKQRYGAFDDFEPVSMGGGGSETHDLAGSEDDHAFSENN